MKTVYIVYCKKSIGADNSIVDIFDSEEITMERLIKLFPAFSIMERDVLTSLVDYQ